MQRSNQYLSREIKFAKSLYRDFPKFVVTSLKSFLEDSGLSLIRGDLILLDGKWYVTHSGLLRLARRNRCVGISVAPLLKLSDPIARRWAFRAVVFKHKSCKGFTGYGDADPSNVSPSVNGAEMRVAETRAVNRALRKAYGIGICSIEEMGCNNGNSTISPATRKLPTHSEQNDSNGTGSKVRDRLCQLVRQHQLDPDLVKAYATDYCGTKALREATREQVENFVAHIADWAVKDRNALLCQLNSYLRSEKGAA